MVDKNIAEKDDVSPIQKSSDVDHDTTSGGSDPAAHHNKYTDTEASNAAPVQSVNGDIGDVLVEGINRGPIADRPTSGDTDDEFYYATDQRILWRWDADASDWNAAGGLGSGTQAIPGTARYEALEATGTITDPSGTSHTSELADSSDIVDDYNNLVNTPTVQNASGAAGYLDYASFSAFTAGVRDESSKLTYDFSQQKSVFSDGINITENSGGRFRPITYDVTYTIKDGSNNIIKEETFSGTGGNEPNTYQRTINMQGRQVEKIDVFIETESTDDEFSLDMDIDAHQPTLRKHDHKLQ